MDRRVALQIELTPEQQAQVRQAIAGEGRGMMKLAPEQLEDRVAPLWLYIEPMAQRQITL